MPNLLKLIIDSLADGASINVNIKRVGDKLEISSAPAAVEETSSLKEPAPQAEAPSPEPEAAAPAEAAPAPSAGGIDLNDLYRRGVASYRAGNYGDARELFQTCLNNIPSDKTAQIETIKKVLDTTDRKIDQILFAKEHQGQSAS